MNNSSNKYVQLVGGFIAIVFGVLQGIDWLFKKYEINSFYFNIILKIHMKLKKCFFYINDAK